MSITPRRKREIKNIAIDILKENNQLRPPVNLDLILNNQNIIYFETDLSKYISDEQADAYIYKNNGENIIAVNTNNHLYECKRRFTVAHELGHYFLHMREQEEYLAARNGSIGHQTDEEEANYFAANLLMPDDMVMEASYYSHMNTVEDMANLFQVSFSAMKIKLSTLGLI